MYNHRKLYHFLIALLVALPTSLIAATAATPLEIHVGIYAPFSDERAAIGRNILGAMELARDQIQSKAINYTFITFNKAPNVPVTASSLQKFITSQHIDVLVTEGAQSGLVAAAVASKHNILHFCMTDNPTIADGKNNYVAWNRAFKQAAVLEKGVKPAFVSQYIDNYQSHPLTEAGYAYDVLQIVHNSTVLAMKGNSHLSSDTISQNLHVIAAGKGVMGTLGLDKTGVLYAVAEQRDYATI